jgi:hypothetical protein
MFNNSGGQPGPSKGNELGDNFLENKNVQLVFNLLYIQASVLVF